MKGRLRAPSPALVIALIALFVALGGTSYAAIKLPKNSVGAKQLKSNAVTGAKIKNGAVTAAKIDTSGLTVPNAVNATSAASATSAINATSATSATNATNAANASALGGHGASFFAAATLQSGQSESGDWFIGGQNAASFAGTGVAYPTPLAAPIEFDHVDFTTSSDTHCSGAGHAAAGWLCVYASTVQDESGFGVFGLGAAHGSDTWGFFVDCSATGTPALADGTWTVTAP